MAAKEEAALMAVPPSEQLGSSAKRASRLVMQRLAEAEPEAYYKTTHQVSKLPYLHFEDGLTEVDLIRTRRFSLLFHKP